MQANKQVTLQAKVHCEDGMYWAEVPSHPGLFASGETLDELTEALAEAWILYSEDAVAATHIEKSPRAPAKKAATKRATPAPVPACVDQLRLLVPA